MAGQGMTMKTEFPRSFRGYSTIAVDDFIRQLGTRLDSLQQWTEAQGAQIERLTADLQSADSNLSAFMEKELALANALVQMEKQRLLADQEIEVACENANIQISEMMAEARREAEAIVAEAMREAEGIRDEFTTERAAAEDQLRQLRAEYEATVSNVRRTLEAELALLCEPVAAVAVTHAAVTAEPSRVELVGAAA